MIWYRQYLHTAFFGFACYKYYLTNRGSDQNDYKIISIILLLSIIVRLFYLTMRLGIIQVGEESVITRKHTTF